MRGAVEVVRGHSCQKKVPLQNLQVSYKQLWDQEVKAECGLLLNTDSEVLRSWMSNLL